MLMRGYRGRWCNILVLNRMNQLRKKLMIKKRGGGYVKLERASDHFLKLLLLLLLVFSPWAGLGRDQSSVRRLVWLWYSASWASS